MVDENLLHRDDLNDDVLAAIQAQFPGMKIVCAGDRPDLMPPDLRAAVEQLQIQHDESLLNGTCIDCGAQMPDYDPDREDWQPPKGWTWFMQSDRPVCWQCPECDEKERAEA